MPGTDLLPGAGTPARGPARRVARAAAAAGLTVLAVAGLSGCYTRASAAPVMELTTATVPQPDAAGDTSAYLVIRNNGAADRLISARTSAGGRVTFRAPVGHGNLTMRPVTAIAVPGHTLIRLVPNSAHLLITGARPMQGGKEITLTLVFAHAGTISILAQVTNPETGGSSYFMN